MTKSVCESDLKKYYSKLRVEKEGDSPSENPIIDNWCYHLILFAVPWQTSYKWPFRYFHSSGAFVPLCIHTENDNSVIMC